MYTFTKYALMPLMLAAFMTPLNAQTSVYQDPERCVAEMSALDADGDGYLTDDEVGEYMTISTRVDTDGDGRISSEELVVACEQQLVEALEGSGR
ncbi:EF-hand domain-containing protein [Dichotomicrobium thermohalophilum]|uniref:EF hand domain-containing protein n=1 Tax=Dichotomicrobium thermohalophilum TaxID=933063 RepID=A0A397Q2L7_9HYPH|nr:EF-hand domain-containing protein [Dichotomicrobium thermohalophilum]RIA55750.1 EF hand domain-containing protein [Dichotomicrobium thermohalophilum]